MAVYLGVPVDEKEYSFRVTYVGYHEYWPSEDGNFVAISFVLCSVMFIS